MGLEMTNSVAIVCESLLSGLPVTALRSIHMRCTLLDVEDAMAASMLEAKLGQVVVNRVSDAAPLEEAKKCTASGCGCALFAFTPTTTECIST